VDLQELQLYFRIEYLFELVQGN